MGERRRRKGKTRNAENKKQTMREDRERRGGERRTRKPKKKEESARLHDARPEPVCKKGNRRPERKAH